SPPGCRRRAACRTRARAPRAALHRTRVPRRDARTRSTAGGLAQLEEGFDLLGIGEVSSPADGASVTNEVALRHDLDGNSSIARPPAAFPRRREAEAGDGGQDVDPARGHA